MKQKSVELLGWILGPTRWGRLDGSGSAGAGSPACALPLTSLCGEGGHSVSLIG